MNHVLAFSSSSIYPVQVMIEGIYPRLLPLALVLLPALSLLLSRPPSPSLTGVGANNCSLTRLDDSPSLEVTNKKRCEGRWIAWVRSTSGEVDEEVDMKSDASTI
jgi:hypothetical protein